MFGQNEKINRLQDELNFLRKRVNEQEVEIWKLKNPPLFKNGDKVHFIPHGQVLAIELTVLESRVEEEFTYRGFQGCERRYNCVTSDYKLINGIYEDKLLK
jgi:hypothetical protein